MHSFPSPLLLRRFAHPHASVFSLSSTAFLPFLISRPSLLSTTPSRHHPIFSPIPTSPSCPHVVLLPINPRVLLSLQCVHREPGKRWGINNTANKPPASCRGLVLLNVWTEIEAGNLAVELEQIERTVGGKSQTSRALILGTSSSAAVDVGAKPGDTWGRQGFRRRLVVD